MTDQNEKSVFQKASDLTKPPPGSALSTWQIIVRVVAIGIPILGAVPTAYTLYQSYQHDIPYDQVSYRLAQYELWVKNLDCQIEYQALNTGQDTRVDVGACPKTGDIAIKVSSQDGNANYQWIPYDEINGRKRASAMLDWAIASAHAAEAPSQQSSSSSQKSFRVADTGMTVVCQKLTDKKKGKLLRIVKEGDKCYKESFSLFKGAVDDRVEVMCDTTCNGTTNG